MRVSRAATRRLEGAICSLKNDSGLVQMMAHMSRAAAGAVLSEHGSLSMCRTSRPGGMAEMCDVQCTGTILRSRAGFND